MPALKRDLTVHNGSDRIYVGNRFGGPSGQIMAQNGNVGVHAFFQPSACILGKLCPGIVEGIASEGILEGLGLIRPNVAEVQRRDGCLERGHHIHRDDRPIG